MTELRAERLAWVAAAVLAIACLSGCATANPMHNGLKAEQLKDYDLAVVEYTRAVRDKPDDRNARRALERAKLRAAQEHFTRGRRLLNGSKLDEAIVEFQLAAEMNPGNKEIEDAVRSVRTQLRARIAVAREGKTRLETLIERTRSLPCLLYTSDAADE